MVVEFRVLGEVEARVGGQRVDLGHARQRCVLVMLLVEANQVVSADQLVDRVWGERLPLRARDTLYSYLSRLRHALATVNDEVGLMRQSGGVCPDRRPAGRGPPPFRPPGHPSPRRAA